MSSADTAPLARSAPGDDLLALRLRALAHPARLAIVRGLAGAERCQCGQIVRGLNLAQSTVSQHLKVLKEAGLITGTIEGPRSRYCLDRSAIAALAREIGPLLQHLADGGGPGCSARSPDAADGAFVDAGATPI